MKEERKNEKKEENSGVLHKKNIVLWSSAGSGIGMCNSFVLDGTLLLHEKYGYL
ncbi:MAG: hypothetical protein ACLTBS_06000 [Eisenbergiella sp.]